MVLLDSAPFFWCKVTKLGCVRGKKFCTVRMMTATSEYLLHSTYTFTCRVNESVEGRVRYSVEQSIRLNKCWHLVSANRGPFKTLNPDLTLAQFLIFMFDNVALLIWLDWGTKKTPKTFGLVSDKNHVQTRLETVLTSHLKYATGQFLSLFSRFSNLYAFNRRRGTDITINQNGVFATVRDNKQLQLRFWGMPLET